METQLERQQKRRIQIVPSAESLAKEAARIFIRAAISAIERRGRFCVLLSGGTTPKRMFEVLAGKNIPWSHIQLFWGDERMVPADQAESNFGMTQRTLLSKVSIPPENIHRIHGEMSTAPEAAAAYEEDLRKFFGNVAMPEFDLIYLGLGPEGHTASLFPENRSKGSLATDYWVRGYWVEKFHMWRVSVGLGLINAARSVVFLVSGASKGAVLRTVIKQGSSSDMPAAHVVPVRGEVHWLIDLDAAMAMKS